MDNMVTRCPQCKTSFRISQAQLKTALGAVRCGSCLTIFKATENLVGQKPAAPATTPQAKHAKITPKKNPAVKNIPTTTTLRTNNAPTPISTPPPAKPAVIKTEEKLINDNTQDDSLDAPLNHTDTYTSSIGSEINSDLLSDTQLHSTSLFDRKPQEIKDDPLDNSDESWAVNLLEDEEDDEATDRANKFEPRNTSDLNLNPELDSTTNTQSPNDEFDQVIHSNRDAGSFTFIDDEADYASTRSQTAHNPSFFIEDDEHTDNNQANALDQLAEFESNNPTEQNLEQNPTQTNRTVLQDFEPAPVEMAFRVEVPTWPRNLLWGSLSAAAILILFIQWNIYNFQDLSRQQPYRNWYTTLCPILGCTLPSRSAPAKISSYNLVVRSHPDTANALIVDTILLNRASFIQPFPLLRLTFSDRDHKPLASRSFSPQEYLRGELAGRKMMPTGQPIHIALEITDPGPSAVNYSASIDPTIP